MSSDSDTDDYTQMKQFMEAADTDLLNNSMFQGKEDENESTKQALNKDPQKSQRYISEDKESSWNDFNLPESMQKHLAKKLNEILKKHYEFCDVSRAISPKRPNKNKSRLKLLKGVDCFVNSYEDFQYDTKGPEKKPEIRRRVVHGSRNYCIDKDSLKLVAVDANYILSGQEANTWAKKKERKDKIFRYKMASNGILHSKEESNEFTEIRRKNNWNEGKIKCFKKS